MVDLTIPVDHSENKRKWKESQVLRICQRTKKKTMEHEGDSDSNYNWGTRKNSQRFGKKDWKN